MSLQPGARLGPYQIVAALGAGGVGEAQQSPVISRQASVAELDEDLD